MTQPTAADPGPPRGASEQSAVAATDPAAVYRQIGEKTSQILVAAEEAGKEIRELARREAAEVLADARAKAAEIVMAAQADRRAAEHDLQRLREARAQLATQLEVVRRRLDETIALLRAPMDEPPEGLGRREAAAPVGRGRPATGGRPYRQGPLTARAASAASGAAAGPPPAEGAGPSASAGAGAGAAALTAATPTEPPAEGAALPESSRGGLSPNGAAVQAAWPPGSPEDQALTLRSQALGESPWEAARRVKSLLGEDQNDLLDRLRRHRGPGTFDRLLDPEEHVARFSAGLRDVLHESFLAGRHAAGAAGDGNAAAAALGLIAKQLVQPLRRDLGRVVDAGLEAGDTTASISERVSDIFRVWKGVRAEPLGEGLAYAAFHQGLAQAWQEGGPARKRWVPSPDEPSCPRGDCRANAGAGAVDVLAPFPSGHLVPPAHGGCECTIIGSAG